MSQVLTYIRNLLHINPNKRQRVEENQEAPHQKYRRVSNNFPLKHRSPIDDDNEYFKKVKQSQIKYKELIERNMDPNQNRKKEPFRAFNINDDDEEFSDSEFDLFASKTRGTNTNDNSNNQRRRNDLQHKQQEQQPSSSGYSGFSQYNDRRMNGFDLIANNADKKTIRANVPQLVPISRSVQLFMNGSTNNWNNQNNTRNGTSQSISPQPTRGKKTVFSFGRKSTPQFEDSAIYTPNSIMVRNHKMKVRNEYDLLLKQLVPDHGLSSADHKRFPNSGPPSLAPFTKPSTFATVDLSLDDDEETVAVAMKSIKESKNAQYGRKSDFVFKRPDTSFVELSDDENETINFRKNSVFSSTLADTDRIRKSSSDSKSSSSLKTITSSDIQPVNSLKERQLSRPFLHDIGSICRRYNDSRKHRESLIKDECETVSRLSITTKANEKIHGGKVRDYISSLEQITISDDEEDEPENEYPELDEKQHNFVRQTLHGGSKLDVVMVKFSISVTRNDLYTLVGDSWLNDEVINFYMNLLMDRSEKNDSLPKVYAMNTFFIPKLLQSGHSGLKRWTRKVDIFSFDVIPIPVHVGGVHWCMSIIHLKNKSIKYYDSMGHQNYRVLDALEQYLKDESLDKKNEQFDMTDWSKECVRDCPRQMNGSDCGVFSCMFAEFVSRDSKISFTQEKMQYFRKKMIYEIATGKLMLRHDD
ncbi:unnamed protein product [Diamesa serratosioi]